MGLHGATFVAPLPGTPPVGMSATDGRLVMGGLFGTTPQLVAGGGISQSGSNMQFTIAQSVFQLPDVTNAAATAFLPTDSTVLTPAVGPGTGSRKDLICIPFKNYENGDASSQSQPILVAGTTGTPGVDPPVPAGSYKYAEITVGTGVTTASACTVVTYGNTTFAPPALQCPTVALLQTITGSVNQHATVYADGLSNGEFFWSGSAWTRAGITAWTSYTPTFTALTASAVDFQWRREGQLIRVRPKFTCTAQTNNPGFTLPVAAETLYQQFETYNGVLSRSDGTGNGGAVMQVAAVAASTTDIRIYGWGYAALSAGAIPSGYLVQGEFTYRPAS